VGGGAACLLVSGIFLYFGNLAAAKEVARVEEKLVETERQLTATQKELAEIEALVKELHLKMTTTLSSSTEPFSSQEIISPLGLISMLFFLFCILAYLWFSYITPEMRDTYLLRLRQYGNLIRTFVKENILPDRWCYLFFLVLLCTVPFLEKPQVTTG
jgi:hypothetical protein